jgi:hypothetical protein
MLPHRGSVILTLGILGLVVCPLLGIAAWQMGNDDLSHMRYGRMEPSGRDLTSAGRVLGMVATGIFVIQIIAIGLFLIITLLIGHR